jgi:hypothetical protein
MVAGVLSPVDFWSPKKRQMMEKSGEQGASHGALLSRKNTVLGC